MSQLILIPENILLTTVRSGLKAIREDYKNTVDKQKTWLGVLLSDGKLDEFEYLKQLVKVIVNNDEADPRFLDVDLGFNMSTDRPISIHITMPSESPGMNALGNDEGYQELVYNDPLTPTEYKKVFTRRYKSVYDIVVVSDNSVECLLVYHVLKALLVTLTAHLSLSGLQNLTFSGQDLQPYADLVPKNVFMKAIRLGIEYESSTPTLENYPIMQGVIFQSKVVSEL